MFRRSATNSNPVCSHTYTRDNIILPSTPGSLQWSPLLNVLHALPVVLQYIPLRNSPVVVARFRCFCAGNNNVPFSLQHHTVHSFQIGHIAVWHVTSNYTAHSAIVAMCLHILLLALFRIDNSERWGTSLCSVVTFTD